MEGLTSITIPLVKQADGRAVERKRYTVRLMLAEPEEMKPGQRVFDVVINGETRLEGVDPAALAGGARRSAVAQILAVEAGAEIKIELVPTAGVPLLCGVEVVADPQ